MSIFDAPYEKQDFYSVRSYIIPLINMAWLSLLNVRITRYTVLSIFKMNRFSIELVFLDIIDFTEIYKTKMFYS